MENCDTREEAVRRVMDERLQGIRLASEERQKWYSHVIGEGFEAGEKFGREAALRKVIQLVDDALNCECGYSDNRSKSKYNTECGHAMNCPKYLVYELLAIPVAGKKEKA